MRSLLLLSLFACTQDDPVDDTPTEVVLANDLSNPLAPDDPILPYPSDQYLVPDDTRPSGLRVDIGEAIRPPDITADMVAADGFSRVSPLVAHLPGGFDASQLPAEDDWGASLSADAPVLLARASDGQLLPVLAELDLRADEDAERALLIRSHRVLDPETRYVVVLRDTLTKADGSAHTVPDAVTRLLAGEAEGRAETSWLPAFDDVRTVLDTHGIGTDEVLLTWTFTTRSETEVLAKAVGTQDIAAAEPLGTWTPEPLVVEDDRALLYGSLTVPNFLDETGRIQIGPDGTPQVFGTMQAPVLVTIPATIGEPRPVMLFGHGFFSAIEEPTWDNLFGGLETWQMAAVTTEFFGFSEATLLETAPILANRIYDFDTVIDRQLQSQANFTAVHRLITDVLADSVEVDFGNGPIRPLDGANVPYMGISNGGTQGLVMLTTSPRLTRGAVVVPGGGWSHMLQRASQWEELGAVLTGRYPDPVQLQVVMSMLQNIFDPVDSLNFVQHLVTDRLPGRPADPEVLMIEAMGDEQVANLVTRWIGLNADLPVTTPSPVSVFELDEVEAPLPDGAPRGQGYTIYDLGYPPVPPGNQSPTEHGAHAEIRLLDSYKTQMGTFLETGRVVHPCDGPCDPE